MVRSRTRSFREVSSRARASIERYRHVSGVGRRSVLLGGLASLGATALGPRLGGAASDLVSARAPSANSHGAVRWDRPEGGRVVLDPAQFPTMFRESPALAELVRQRRLPPARERIGQDPLVIAPLREIGKYGGTLRRAFMGPGDHTGIVRFAAGPDGFLYWDCQWRTLVPNIARAFELSRDGRTLTLLLRRGMRWSVNRRWMGRERRISSASSALEAVSTSKSSRSSAASVGRMYASSSTISSVQRSTLI